MPILEFRVRNTYFINKTRMEPSVVVPFIFVKHYEIEKPFPGIKIEMVDKKGNIFEQNYFLNKDIDKFEATKAQWDYEINMFYKYHFAEIEHFKTLKNKEFKQQEA